MFKKTKLTTSTIILVLLATGMALFVWQSKVGVEEPEIVKAAEQGRLSFNVVVE